MTLLLQTLDVIAGLNPEDEQQPEKLLAAEKEPRLEAIVNGFEAIAAGKIRIQRVEENYEPYVRCLFPSAESITKASILLSGFCERNPIDLGLFLTSLVKKIQTNHGLKPVAFLAR